MSLEELKDRARQGDVEALRELRERGFFANRTRAASYPASDAQRRLWVLHQMTPESASYNIPGALRIGGVLDEDAFERALNALVARHDSLRTRFGTIDGELRQIVEPDAAVRLDRVDLTRHARPEAEARTLIAAAAAAPFSLDAVPLLSASLYSLAVDDNVFAFTIHHIVADGWSLGVLFHELMILYDAFARGAADPLEPLRLQYKDITAWQRRRLEEGALDEARRYWIERLAGDLPVLEFPRDFSRPAVQSFSGGYASREIPRATATALEQLAASAGATMFMTLLAAVRVLLLRYGGQPDVVIGTPVAGRAHPDLEQQVGFYVNLLPLRTAVDPADTFVATLTKVRDDAMRAYEHDYPFDRLVDEIDLTRDMSRSPLFDVLLTLEEEGPAPPAAVGLRTEPFAFPSSAAKYDLTFLFTRSRGSLAFAINYSAGLFRRERMEVVADHLLRLLDSLGSQPGVPIAGAAIASAAEIATVSETFGRASADYPRERSIAEVFEEQVAATPEAEAVLSEAADGEVVRLTYGALNGRADRLARRLRARGVGLETPVGVLLERSERVAVALLGILKAGGCYVPLETRAPAGRTAFMVGDAGCRLVIDETELARLEANDDEAGESRTPAGRPNGRNLAYVMYTSGSSGEPKGALVEQRSVLRLVLGNRFLRLGRNDRMLQTGSLAFDASTLEIWGPLLNGGCVCFAPGEDILVTGAVRTLIARHRITTMWVTASLLNQWVDGGEDVFGTLTVLLTGGEKLSRPHIARLRRRYPELVIINGYGPTENTTFTTCHRIEQVDEGDIPIGRPISNTSVLILDDNGAMCPIGIAGEICAGGDGMARGYLRRPELTAEQFVPNPFAAGERLYRTGDLGRWRWDGTVEFLGRRDMQVKVRGYRIEPGEIEARLLQHPLVTEACVVARETDEGTRELVAYFVSAPEVATIAVRDRLAGMLPPYMVPSRFARLEAMPLTRNGKVDRASLPAPDDSGEHRTRFEPPRTPVERTLCAIWSDVLQVRDVGVRDNFFELGGHSLKATRVLTRIHRELSDRVTLRDLFAHPDVASLAGCVGPASSTRRAAIPRAVLAGPAPASHAQRRLWLLQQLSGDTGAYNVPGAVLLDGELDAAALSFAFTRLVERHESLRTGFVEIDGELCQNVVGPFAVDIPVHDVSDAGAPADEARRLAAADAEAPFALGAPPLFRVLLFRLAPARHVFYFNLHHIVTDGWSMRVLLGELLELYRTAQVGAGDRLPPLAVQYRDYAVWQRDQLAREEGRTHRQYWLDRFRDDVPALELPSDLPRPAVQTFRGDVVRAALDAATVARLRRFGQQHGATMYTVLLAVVRTLLFRHTAQEEFVLGTGVSGRDHADLDDQVGFYVNMLPLRQRVSARQTFLDVLRETRDVVSEALEHQAYPFDLLVGDLQLRREAGRQPMFDVVVTLEEAEGGAKTAASVPGLQASTFDLPAPFSKFDLMFAFTNGPDVGRPERTGPTGACAVALEYSTDLFERGRIERMMGHLAQLVASVLTDATTRVEALDLLPDDERRQLARFAGGASPYPAERTVAQLFERQAALTPGAVAIVAGDRQLTYAELNARADRVASALRARGVTHEERVGVRLDRSERIVVALVGILKAGGCYVPLEPGAPAERIAFMVADAGCRFVIDEATLALLESGGEGAAGAGLAGQSGRSLAYVMYTSGSTGQPKGTLIEQRSIVRLVLGSNCLQLGPADRMLQTGSIAFDASTLEIWGPLLNGGCICFAPGDVLLDAARMQAAISAHGITAMFVTTSLFNQLVDGDPDVFAGLRCLMTGGEKVSVAHITAVARRHPEIALLHVYGPTENTTFTTFFPVDVGAAGSVAVGAAGPADVGAVGPADVGAVGPADVGAAFRRPERRADDLDVPIGRPLANTTVYILDGHGGPAPIGVAGEICTGGDGLARGYLNRPELTAERFVPLALDPGGRVYRTGDVGRWRADGAIEFIGRRDNQVKVHGYRVEPGEIEARLLQHRLVTQAAVLARETTVGTRELVAYYAGTEAATVASVRGHLATTLPAYMVPSEFVQLPALPLNQNGKIDRGRLAAMRSEPVLASEEAWAAPATTEERALAEVWGAVLERPRVSREDDYFDSGGDSIRAIQIVNRLRKAGWSFDVRDVFQYPVLREAALRLTKAASAAAPAASEGPIPLTPIQRWFFTRSGDLHHFNHAVLLTCAGGLREDLLRPAVAALIEHHLALRLAVGLDASGCPAAMTDAGPALVASSVCDVRDLRGVSVEAWQQDMDAVQRGFDLARGPLFKAVLYRLAGGDRLLLVAHHLIIDGVSWRIVLEDLEQAYGALAAGDVPALTPQTHSYAEWARALAASTEPGAPPGMERRQTVHTYGDCEFVEVVLGSGATGALLREVHTALNTTIDDILLTALARALKQVDEVDRTWIAMEGHGRDTVPGIDVGAAVGWFTRVYPLLLPLVGDDARQQIRHVKEALRAARRRPVEAPPECRISFNYMGQVDERAAQDGRFALADEACGNPIGPTLQRAHEIEIGGIVRGGRLTLSLTFSRQLHSRDHARRLLDEIAGELDELIACCRGAAAERTPSDFTSCPLTLPEYDALLAANEWARGAIEDVYPLTPMQEGLLFQSLLDEGSRVYFLQLSYRMAGPLDVDRFRAAWDEVARRHAVLRGSIVHEGVDRPLQVILADRRPEIRFEDLSRVAAGEQAQRVEACRRLDMERGVDLQREPLMRMAILRLGTGVHHVIWSYHHVLLDGWSLGILYREFQEIYRALASAEPPAVPAPHAFAEYLRWLLRQDDGAARAYWTGYLADHAPASLVDQLAGASVGAAGAEATGELTARLDRDVTRKLGQTAAAAGVTLNTVIQALWAVLLARYTGSSDVAFGAVVSGRPSALPGVEDMVGLFINTVPVRVRIDEGEPVIDFLRRLQREAVAAEPFHFFPLAEVQALQPGDQLFDHLLVFENYPLESDAGAAADAIRIEAFEAHDRTHYDLDLTIVPGDSLEIRFSYRPGRLDAQAVKRLAGHLTDLASAALERPDQPVSRLRCLSINEEAALLGVGRGPQIAYPVERPIGLLFEAQALAAPQAIAARHGGRELTYAALNARANRIAHWLREAGVGRGDIVGLVERRGLDLFAAMLGVLKAGGAFLPIDPEYPADRIRFMLEDSGVTTVVTRGPAEAGPHDSAWPAEAGPHDSPWPAEAGPHDSAWPAEAGPHGSAGPREAGPRSQAHGPHVRVLDLDGRDLAARPATNLPSVNGPRDVAYLLYTSGSTGRPKGAQVRHDGAVNHIFAEFDLLRFHCDTVFLQSAPSSSDISVWQFLAPGLIGARTVVADHEDVADPARLFALMRDEGVTLCELVPVVIKGLLDYAATLDAEARALPALEWAMVTGESVPVPLVNQWVAAYPRVPLVNAYGPTEAADDICQSVIAAPLPVDAATVPIGRPLANLRLYVLDGSQQLVPFGVAGEICVSGIGVGAGYWRDEARTAEAFVANPYTEAAADAVLYRTGDRGRWRPDGELECLGRLDRQVKVRGFRVELEEVEHRLLEHPGVRHAVAGIRAVGGDQALVAWVVGEAPGADLRQHLRARVPAHMIPSFFVTLDDLPRTPSGKIDRRALPAPDASGIQRGSDHAPPATPVEQQLAAIWSQVLQVPQVGRDDSFFDLGGHSLKAMQAVSRVHRDLGIRVSLQDFFARPTVAALAELVAAGTAAAFQPIAAVASQPDYELSHAQKRLWLLHHLDGSVAYNMPEAVVLDEPVDRDALRRAFATLVDRHEVLRTAFVMVDGEPRQRILDAVELVIREVDLTGAASEADGAATAAADAAAEAAVPFDLTRPPLLRAVLYRLTPLREVFLMVIHHIIGDGWSMNVLYREILALYDAYRHGRPDPLQPLGIQYKDFACWQNRQDMSRDERYWLDTLAGAPDRISLPFDTEAIGDRDFRGSIEHLRLDVATTTRLQALAAAHGTTLSNVVLSLFQLFLYQWTRQDDICVGLAIANRNRPDLENLIGFFVNILPIRVQLASDMEFADLLALVRARTGEAFEHQDYPFDLLVQRLNPGRDSNRQPVLNVIYGFQNFEDVAINVGVASISAPTGQPPATALVRPFSVPFETSKFDLTLFVTDMEGELQLSLEYDTSLFQRGTIRRALAVMGRFAERVE
jgi:amino acid adenylation domain-containing protein/non-ribosomal peptide synthase protein (TIGR01720 family)